ncbi:hypothetical protein D7V86_19295 [bacterium D16-51]|nr:hypothetical protein D7V96_16605 [bacterium D16-59]RKI56610.1 hypothetical protein D7V86_19295 [bacterium D16-51]
MKRKVIYLAVGVGIIAVIGAARTYEKSLAGQAGYLGSEIIFYRESASASGTGHSGTDTLTAAEKKKKLGQKNSPAPSPAVTETPSPTVSPEKKGYEKIISDGKIKVYDTATVVLGDSAYELYTYVNSAASRYAKAVNKLTKSLDSSVKVYSMVAPTSVGITFPDNKRKSLNSSSQKEALEDIEHKLSGREVFVPLYDKLMRHRTEYIFFRTDHHWTSLGAYYAYEAFCEAKNMTPNQLSGYEVKKSENFTGSFYRETYNDKNLRADTLEAIYPLSQKLSMKYTTAEGKVISAPVIADASKYGSGMKYSAYIAGDNPYTVIQNKEITDGSSCVVVKESYGNAFVPFLADHYQTVYVIDYRYWEGKLVDFIKENKTREVILVNNISMTRNSYLIGKLMSCLNN